MKYRCKLNWWWALVALLATANAWAGGPSVRITHNLQADAANANQRGVPIMLVFGAHGCRYCELLDRDFLKPMLISGDYTNKVLIREVMISDDSNLVDFAGKQIPTTRLANRYHVTVTPTVVFVDARGRQLTAPMVGVSSPDFYGAYLDQAIATALKKLRAEPQATTAHWPASRFRASG